VFVTEPLHGHVAVHDRFTGRDLGLVPAPADGFLLPFTLRVVREGRLVVLDAGGFPNPGTLTIPRVYDYDYAWDHAAHRVNFTLVRAVRFDGLPVGFTEDVEVLDDGRYVVSDSILGSIWVVGQDGAISPGMTSDTPGQILPALGMCITDLPTPSAGGIPFALVGNVAPGVGSMGTDGSHLYFGDSCRGGIYRVPIASLADSSRSPAARSADVEVVSPSRPGEFEVIKGLTFNRWEGRPRTLYALDAFKLRLIAVNVHTGTRRVVADDPVLFNFPVAAAFLPSWPGLSTLVVASDQEHRFAAINHSITEDMFQPPWLVTEVLLRP
jgi:hypothetical protein